MPNSDSDDRLLHRFAVRLAAWRVERGLTQAQLAKQSGVSKRTVERLEAGESTQFRSVLRVLRVLGLLGGLDALVPEPSAGPLERLRQQEQRPRPKRVRPASPSEPEGTWTWGDET